jgi:hypothetical protein
MKRSLLLLFVMICGLTLVSCSGDDSPAAPPIETTKIVGTWELDYYVENGILEEDVACDDKITYSFTNTKTYTKTTFAEDDNSTCVTAVVVNGKWEYMDGNQFKLTPNGSSSNESLNVSFLDNYTKFQVKISSTYTEIYVKQVQ